VEFAFDSAKNDRNIKERNLPFHLAADFDWASALILPSDRKGEERYLATGYLGGKLHALVFTKRGARLWVISLRRANPKEVRRYEKETRS
jgi:uncharacterized DUF497 family protein